MSGDEPTVLYVGNFEFPTNGAAAKRVLNVGRALRMLGYRTVYAGNNDQCREEDVGHDGVCRYEHFEYRARGELSALRRRLDSYNSFPRLRRVIEACDDSGCAVDLVIGYHMDAIGMALCMRYCKERGIAFIADTTEWYDPVQTLHGRLGAAYTSSQARMMLLQKRADGVFAVSRFLERYYARHTKVLRVPPLDCVADVWRYERRSGCMRFVYCGTPGKKDDLGVILEAFSLLGLNRSWELHLVGVDEVELPAAVMKHSERSRGSVTVHGRLASSDAQEIVAGSDFSILMRPAHKRYAEAGFPTKVTESLSLGTPVIANISSDLADYLVDGSNAIVVGGASARDLTCAIERALSLSHAELRDMACGAHRTALISLDYRVHAGALSEFIQGCMGRAGRASSGMRSADRVVGEEGGSESDV